MNKLNKKENYTNQTFEDIKHIAENGIEYWYARELQLVLDYKEWRKFENVIKKAKDACENSGINAFEHFVGADKLSKRATNAGVRNFDKFHNSGYKGLYKQRNFKQKIIL